MPERLDNAIKAQNHHTQSAERWAALNRANSSHDLDSFVTIERLKMEWLRSWGEHLIRMEDLKAKRLKNQWNLYVMNQRRRVIRRHNQNLREAEAEYSKKMKQLVRIERLFDGMRAKRRDLKPGWLILERWMRGSLSKMPATDDLLVTTNTDRKLSTRSMLTQTMIGIAADQWCRINMESEHWETFRGHLFEVRDNQLASGRLLLDSIDAQETELFDAIGKLDG